MGPSYFTTFRIPVLAGREFVRDDAGGRPLAIVNQAMARHYFGERSPLGKHLSFDGQPGSYEIIGVVGDAKYSDLHEAPPRTVYLNAFQGTPGRAHQFAVRTSVRPESVGDEVRRTIRDVVGDVPVMKMTTLADQVDASIVPERLMAMLASVFGFLGSTLMGIGIYGLLAYTVTLAFAAAYPPARRAARIDPGAALRQP